ncbi:hypothetical protein KIL84_020149 [Mauremys mutica]|uniref:Uncharacterized protein n=1 Tax=Mauremys mutica TaxID=74926 RepID=A0A9D3XY33_9SAUR|nr:hypothetical protein KIL84_020149 [Mauremys mutica]
MTWHCAATLVNTEMTLIRYFKSKRYIIISVAKNLLVFLHTSVALLKDVSCLYHGKISRSWKRSLDCQRSRVAWSRDSGAVLEKASWGIAVHSTPNETQYWDGNSSLRRV